MRQNPLLLKEGLRFDRTKTQPCLRTSEVGRFLRKRHVCGHGPSQRQTAAETERRKDGPLGDRSLPRKLFGLQSKVPTANSALPVHLRALTGRPHTPDAGSGDPAYTGPRR